MTLFLGVDLGTTKLTALALDAATLQVVAHHSAANDAETTSPADKARGYCEWDVRRITDRACECLRGVADQLGERRHEIAAIGITGQQHGVVLVDRALTPLTPFINWQDRRTVETHLPRALERVGPETKRRTGCRLSAGYMGVTLFWMKETGVLPPDATACFVMDYFAALLTGQYPVTDATCAASSGVFDITRHQWDAPILDALGLPTSLFPAIRPSGERLGGLTREMAARTGLAEGTPVCVGVGDNQASFLGSVGDPSDAVLVNVGTGGQVAAFSEAFRFDPMLETRPFPRGGYLLVSAGLSGGAAYAVLERFYRQVASQLLGIEPDDTLFARMNALAARVPSGSDGLRCDPFFNGTRAQPELRGTMEGVSLTNFTPAHLTRAVLEGMARAFYSGYERIRQHISERRRLVGAGNGIRENAVLAAIIEEAFKLPMQVSPHREEAAYGAALLASLETVSGERGAFRRTGR